MRDYDALEAANYVGYDTKKSIDLVYEGDIPSIVGKQILLIRNRLKSYYIFVDKERIPRARQKYGNSIIRNLGTVKRDFKPIHKIKGEFEVKEWRAPVSSKTKNLELDWSPNIDELDAVINSEIPEVMNLTVEMSSADVAFETDSDYQPGAETLKAQIPAAGIEEVRVSVSNAILSTQLKVVDILESELILIPSFHDFWEAYGNKKDMSKAIEKWAVLSANEKVLIMKDVAIYLKSLPNKLYQKSPVVYLSGRSWDVPH